MNEIQKNKKEKYLEFPHISPSTFPLTSYTQQSPHHPPNQYTFINIVKKTKQDENKTRK